MRIYQTRTSVHARSKNGRLAHRIYMYLESLYIALRRIFRVQTSVPILYTSLHLCKTKLSGFELGSQETKLYECRFEMSTPSVRPSVRPLSSISRAELADADISPRMRTQFLARIVQRPLSGVKFFLGVSWTELPVVGKGFCTSL